MPFETSGVISQNTRQPVKVTNEVNTDDHAV